jgi:thymidylate kinase
MAQEVRMLVVFEGHDGVGKTTVIDEVSRTLVGRRYNVAQIRNPAPLFDSVRETVRALHDLEVSFRFYLMANLYSTICVNTSRRKADIILMDRSIYSTIVSHQALGYQVPRSVLDLFPRPELAFWIVMDEQERLHRILGKRDTDQRTNDLASVNATLIQRANELYESYDLIKIDNSGDLGITVDTVIQHIMTKIGSTLA